MRKNQLVRTLKQPPEQCQPFTLKLLLSSRLSRERQKGSSFQKKPQVKAGCASQCVVECREFKGHSPPKSSDSPYLCSSTSTVEERAQPGLMMRYLPSTDRLTTVDPRRLWSPIGPPSTTTASLGQSSWNS